MPGGTGEAESGEGNGLSGRCIPCWERYKRVRPAYRLEMCRKCFSGKTGEQEEQAEFRARHRAAVQRNLKERWKDPEFRARNRAAVQRKWKQG